MSEGTGPRNEERQCADADGDHRFCYDEDPQSRHEHEKAAHDDDCRLSRERYRGAHRFLQMERRTLRPLCRSDRRGGFARSRQRFVRWGHQVFGRRWRAPGGPSVLISEIAQTVRQQSPVQAASDVTSAPRASPIRDATLSPCPSNGPCDLLGLGRGAPGQPEPGWGLCLRRMVVVPASMSIY
jgi:hypothetical protein